MITVEIFDGKIEIKGHAGYNPGNDIVCSAVSVLAYTMVSYMERNPDYFDSFCYCMKSGDTRICYKIKEAREEIVRDTMRAILHGICLVGDSYPENVRVLGREKI